MSNEKTEEKIEGIIFDWHGVFDLITFDGMIDIIVKTSSHNYNGDTRSIVDEKCMADKYATGEIKPEEFWELIEKHFGKNSRDCAENYLLTPVLNRFMFELVSKLRDYFELAILSDCSLDKHRVITKTCNLSCFKSHFAFSCYSKGLSKKDDAFFLNLSGKMDVEPKNILYVDDGLKNIQKAQKLRFQVFHFDSHNYSAKETTENLISQIKKLSGVDLHEKSTYVYF